MESCGKMNQEVRDSIVFPKIRTFNDKPLILPPSKYYYIDLNGSYCSCISGIPHTLERDSKINYRINELVKRLYEMRNVLRTKGSMIAKTVKCMMLALYGTSISRSKKISTKYPSDVQKTMTTYAPFVAKFNDNKISLVQSFKPHFNFPQFSKSLLDNYHELIRKISEVVHIYYYNIDAILVNESDFKKLKDLGYIGEELGKFKVEGVFTEFAIKSPKVKMGIREDGSVFRCLVKNSVNYSEFVEEVRRRME
jgi:hypothetical protein